MACLFTLIAVVALVKCRRVIVLEGAEVRGRCGVFVLVCRELHQESDATAKGRTYTCRHVDSNSARLHLLPHSLPPLPLSLPPTPPLPPDGHQNLLLPHLRRRRLAGYLVLHPFRRPGTVLRPCRSLGLSNSPLGRNAHFRDSSLGGVPLLVCHLCPDNYLLGRFVEKGIQARAETRANDHFPDHHG